MRPLQRFDWRTRPNKDMTMNELNQLHNKNFNMTMTVTVTVTMTMTTTTTTTTTMMMTMTMTITMTDIGSLEPGMVQRLLCRNAFGRVDLEEAL